MRFSATLAAAALLAAGLAQAQTKWDMPTAYPPANFHTEIAVAFAQEVDKATGGKLKIQVHSNASLFKAPEIKRAVQTGQAQAGEILLVNFENEWPGYGLDGIPFLASSFKDAWKLHLAAKPALEKKLAEGGMVLLYTVAWPPQGLYVKKEIESVADMRRVKWRAYSPSTAKIAELIGAQPVTIQAAELPQALATGAVESYMSSGATGYDSKTYEHIKYWYDTQAWLPKNAVIVNKRAFDALDKATQDAVMKVAKDIEVRGWKISDEKNEWYKKALAEKGMKVLKPTAKLTNDFKQVGNIMLEDWLKKAGAEGKAIVDAYRKP
jgi:TRAP-type C4-dicarboxylate transport system substrate-binding protein